MLIMIACKNMQICVYKMNVKLWGNLRHYLRSGVALDNAKLACPISNVLGKELPVSSVVVTGESQSTRLSHIYHLQ